MWLALFEHPASVETTPGNSVLYDVDRNEAWFGAAMSGGAALVFELMPNRPEASALAAEVELDPSREWLMRCDRVDFPPGAIAYRHVHPGGGIRRLLCGSLHISAPDSEHTYGPGGAWLEGADYPVLATASPTEDTAFVRVLLLPREWEGKRTIRHVDPADDEKPRLQRATVFLEEPVQL
jgi:hypothetical protein